MVKFPILATFDEKYNKRYAEYGLTFDLANGNGVFKNEELKNKQLYVLNWKPQVGKQELAWRHIVGKDVNIIAYGGTKGTGKSELGINGNLHFMYEYGELFAGTYFRNKAADLEDIINRFKKALYRDYLGKDNKPFYYNAMRRIFDLRNGARIQFSYVENEGLDGIQGRSIPFITFEEPQYMKNMSEQVLPKSEAVWRTSDKVFKKQFWFFNPLGPSTTFLKQEFVDKGHGIILKRNDGISQVFIQASLKDNPKLLENDPSYVKILEAMPEIYRKAWLEGNFDIRAGLAFPELTEEKCMFDEPNFKGWRYPYYISMDWGIASKTVIGFYSVFENKYGEKVIIKFKELVYSGKTAMEIGYIIKQVIEDMDGGENLQSMVADTQIFGKAGATGEPISASFERLGLYFCKAKKDREAGYLKMFQRIKDKRFFVDKSCTYFWKTVPNLVLSETKHGDIDKNPEDHAYDETRYALMHIILPESDELVGLNYSIK